MQSPEVKNGWIVKDDDKGYSLLVNATCEVPEKILKMLLTAFDLLVAQEEVVVATATVFFFEGKLTLTMDEGGIGCVIWPIFYNVPVLQRQPCDAQRLVPITEELVHMLLNMPDERQAKAKVVQLLAGTVPGLRLDDSEHPGYVLEADAQLWRFAP